MTGAKARIGETTSTGVISSGAVSNGGAVRSEESKESGGGTGSG